MAHNAVPYTREEVKAAVVAALEATEDSDDKSGWLADDGDELYLERIADIVLDVVVEHGLNFTKTRRHPGYRISPTGAW